MKYHLYIGSYSREGISQVVLEDGVLRRTNAFPLVNPSYLLLTPDEKRLYAVAETGRYQDRREGCAVSFEIGEGGKLTETSRQLTNALNPCHLTIIGNLLMVANYDSGSVSRFPIGSDGKLGECLPLIQHQGSGPKPDRQAGPHVHQTLLTPHGAMAVTDLGLDSIFFYPTPELDKPAPTPVCVRTPAGFGPRHCAFPKDSGVWYALCELESQLLIYRGAPKDAMLVGRLPVGDGSAPDFPSALRISPDGKMLAAAGRGQNIVDLFAIGENGMPARLTEVSCRGDYPWDVQFSPDGKYLVCANYRSNNLVCFALENGHLEYRSELSMEKPSCVLFTKMNRED